MTLDNHIAKRLLTDETLWFEIIETMYPEEMKLLNTKEDAKVSDKLGSLYDLLRSSNQKSYFITDSVCSKLDLLKINLQPNGHYDWTVFKHLSNRKVTFIFPGNKLLRFAIYDHIISFCHVGFIFEDKKKGTGRANWILFYLDKITGELCEHFGSKDVMNIERFYYALFCFMYLTENDEIELAPGKKYGSKKSPDNILNTTNFPVTIVNSRWNTAVSRNEAFGVSGHFRVQPCGPGRSDSKLIFIEPFEKTGYHRKAKKETSS